MDINRLPWQPSVSLLRSLETVRLLKFWSKLRQLIFHLYWKPWSWKTATILRNLATAKRWSIRLDLTVSKDLPGLNSMPKRLWVAPLKTIMLRSPLRTTSIESILLIQFICHNTIIHVLILRVHAQSTQSLSLRFSIPQTPSTLACLPSLPVKWEWNSCQDNPLRKQLVNLTLISTP